MGRLDGRVAIPAGASHGIGQAIAALFATKGAEAIGAQGGDTFALAADAEP